MLVENHTSLSPGFCVPFAIAVTSGVSDSPIQLYTSFALGVDAGHFDNANIASTHSLEQPESASVCRTLYVCVPKSSGVRSVMYVSPVPSTILHAASIHSTVYVPVADTFVLSSGKNVSSICTTIVLGFPEVTVGGAISITSIELLALFSHPYVSLYV